MKGGDLVKFKANRYLQGLFGYISFIRRNLKSIPFIAVISGLLVAICTYSIYQAKTTSYLLKVNNKPICYVKKLSDVKSILKSVKDSEGDDAIKSITYTKTKEQAKNLKLDEAEKALRYELGLEIKAVEILANGVEIAKVYDRNVADEVIQKAKEYYYPKVNGSCEILSSTIKEQITFKDVNAKASEILNIDDAVKKITGKKEVEKIYIVKEKDTIWDIAIKNNMTVEELRQANPNINIDLINIGQEIKLAVSQPYINVQIVAKIKDREEIPYDTKEVEDKKLSKGVKKVKQEGKNGIADVEKIVTFLNDDTMDEEITKSIVVSKAVDEIVAVGSKVPMYVATGDFIRPSRGVITSRFGYRWGRMHEGIDIAASRGTPIVASDSGKVSFAGWRSGYGYCVMINHGNGYQTLYGHASKLYVKAGQYVNKGQKIAAVGSTGRSTGPHVHFEVRKNGVVKNPLKYIK